MTFYLWFDNFQLGEFPSKEAAMSRVLELDAQWSKEITSQEAFAALPENHPLRHYEGADVFLDEVVGGKVAARYYLVDSNAADKEEWVKW